MKLAVVLGTYNRLDQLKDCIRSIFDQTRTPVRVYVTDAGSTDGTVEYLQAIASDVLIPILVGEKLGQARAYNDVFDIVDTPYVCWLSDDNVIVNRGLDVAVGTLDARSKVGMVGIKVNDVVGPFVDAPYLGAVSKTTGILNVNQGMLRTSVIREVGGFSERFGFYGIDPDLTAKVLLSGHDIAYTRVVGINHSRNWAVGKVTPEQRQLQKIYLDLYVRKWGAYTDEDLLWRAKRRAWTAFQRAFDMHINSHRVILGMNGRDWCNVLTSRYISLLDPLRCWGKSYHLVQSCPPSRRLATLPADPAPAEAAA